MSTTFSKSYSTGTPQTLRKTRTASVRRVTQIASTSQPTKATVFSWNEFLCPLDCVRQNFPLSPTLQQEFAALDRAIVRILLQASSFGPVFVLCESGAQFMETLCPTLFPQCTQFFASSKVQEHIHLICAATALTPAWHGQMLHMICSQRLPKSAIYSLTVFGADSMRAGSTELAKHIPALQFKIIRASSTAVGNVSLAFRKIQSVFEHLGALVQHNGVLDMAL